MESGLLLVDKPQGVTSHDVVAKARKIFKRKDIGHAGTLDPLATGLLVLLVGQATKLSDFILNGDKKYRAKFVLGKVTDTDDITGSVISQTDDFEVTESQVKEVMLSLSGYLELPVPIYSAIKVKGKKLYEKARQGENFTPPMRTMEFRDVTLLSFDSKQVEVEFSCSKGSYVRAWGKALGEKLGCGATMSELRRSQSDPYPVEKALELPTWEPEMSPLLAQDLQNWVPMSQCLPDWPSFKVDGLDEKLLSNGQIPKKLERYLELEYGGRLQAPGVKVLSRRSNRLICLLSFEPPLSFKIRRVFPN